MTAIRQVLGLIVTGKLVVASEIVHGLGVALDDALESYAAAARMGAIETSA